MIFVRDITTPEEYEAVLRLLPIRIRSIVEARIHLTEEILLMAGQNLMLKMDDLRLEYPVPITKETVKSVARLVGKFRSDGRHGIDGTLHRVAAEFDAEGNAFKIIIRVARAIIGVAEPLREIIEQAKGIAVIGPPAVGKTTMLRDVARIRSEVLASGLIIIDSSNEITGDGEEPHPMMRRINRVAVGDPSQQAPKTKRAVRNWGPKEILMDEVGYNGDVPELLSASRNGITAIATMHGKIIQDIVGNPPLMPLLGVAINERTGEREKIADACFDTAIEVHGKGKFRVYTNLNKVVEQILNGETPPYQNIGNWPESEKTTSPASAA